MENITKATTKQWYECGTCNVKMETIEIGGKSDGFDFFGTGGNKGKGFYCNNLKCDKFGYLTIAGIKKEE